eukprot:jgi/Ulvmu1/11455/UM076_0031.1
MPREPWERVFLDFSNVELVGIPNHFKPTFRAPGLSRSDLLRRPAALAWEHAAWRAEQQPELRAVVAGCVPLVQEQVAPTPSVLQPVPPTSLSRESYARRHGGCAAPPGVQGEAVYARVAAASTHIPPVTAPGTIDAEAHRKYAEDLAAVHRKYAEELVAEQRRYAEEPAAALKDLAGVDLPDKAHGVDDFQGSALCMGRLRGGRADTINMCCSGDDAVDVCDEATAAAAAAAAAATAAAAAATVAAAAAAAEEAATAAAAAAEEAAAAAVAATEEAAAAAAAKVAPTPALEAAVAEGAAVLAAIAVAGAMAVVRITFAICAPVSWDKAPNFNGQKSVAFDPSGFIRKGEGNWDADLGSIAHQFFALALHLCLIRPTGLRIGDMFSIPYLIARRGGVKAAEVAKLVEDM